MATPGVEPVQPKRTLHDRCQGGVLLFMMPYLNEIKDSWEFAAVPLHFLAQGWGLHYWGLTISLATLCRLPIHALVTWQGEWLMAPLLTLASGCAAYMLVSPLELHAVMLGVGAGHCMDTCQAEHSLCYRWCDSSDADADQRKRRFRWQAFSATAGYSTGALFGGTIYELGGFEACAVLQFSLCCSLAVLMFGLPVVHDSFRTRKQGRPVDGRDQDDDPTAAAAVVDVVGAASSGSSSDPKQGEAVVPAATPAAVCTVDVDVEVEVEVEKTLRNTTGRFFLPVSLVLLCDGLNIFSYVTEWSLFAIYYKTVFNWSSTLTGAAQMAGDLLAAGILALSTTKCWAWVIRRDDPDSTSKRLRPSLWRFDRCETCMLSHAVSCPVSPVFLWKKTICLDRLCPGTGTRKTLTHGEMGACVCFPGCSCSRPGTLRSFLLYTQSSSCCSCKIPLRSALSARSAWARSS
jgi:hypothetical protein